MATSLSLGFQCLLCEKLGCPCNPMLQMRKLRFRGDRARTQAMSPEALGLLVLGCLMLGWGRRAVGWGGGSVCLAGAGVLFLSPGRGSNFVAHRF